MIGMSISALDVAAAIIERHSPIDPMKLQKLVYLAAGQHLVLLGEPMFGEPIEAWAHGPVVHSVYRAYAGAGMSIACVIDGDASRLSQVMIGCVDSALEHWGGLTGWGLRELTHEKGPWRDYYVAEQNRTPIPNRAILDWFRNVLRSSAGNRAQDAEYDGFMGDSVNTKKDWSLRLTPAMRDLIETLAARAKPAPSWVPRSF
jgi:uncharacterized phage-associated protein